MSATAGGLTLNHIAGTQVTCSTVQSCGAWKR